MAVGATARTGVYLFRRSCVGLSGLHRPTQHPDGCGCVQQRGLRTTRTRGIHLSPQEVTSILRANEYSEEINIPGSIKSFDTNQLASNNPIEDTRTEARCLLTTGMLFGIFDGHGGSACSQVVSERLFQYVAASLLPTSLLSEYISSMESDGQPQPLLEIYNDRFELVEDLQRLYEQSFRSFLKDLQAAQGSGKEFSMTQVLQGAFLRLDTDMSEEAVRTNADAPGDPRTLSVAVSGAVAVLAHVDGAHLHVASAGDCQAVLGVAGDAPGRWNATLLTQEHNADNPQEIERLQMEHPHNESNTLIQQHRLLGQLAPLRALGDYRYKWGRDVMEKVLVKRLGAKVFPPNYYTPPYLTAMPEVVHHRLTPRDRFLVIASDGLWEQLSPTQVVRLVGEHMSGKVTLNPLRLPPRPLRLGEVCQMLEQRRRGLAMKPQDANVATHLVRNALGGTDYGLDHARLSQMLSLPADMVRSFRDDITIAVVFFDADYIRGCPA